MSAKSAQLQVGIFLVIGLLVIGGTVAYFGRLGDTIRPMYSLSVEWHTASNLLKGGKVMLSGTKVGMVTTAPAINSDLRGVTVTLGIYENIKIPANAEFRIETSGLLGDRYVDISVPGNVSDAILQPGQTVKGVSVGGLTDLADAANTLANKAGVLATKSTDVMGDVQTAIKNINSVAEKVDAHVLDEETLKQFRSTMENLSTASLSLNTITHKIEEVANKADDFMVQARQTLITIETTTKNLDSGIASAKTGVAEFNKTMVAAQSLISDARKFLATAQKGGGVLGSLLSDREMNNNIQSFVRSLKERGILWYKDKDAEKKKR